jgi:hypothetical protein
VIAKAKRVIGSAEPLGESRFRREIHVPRSSQKRDPFRRIEDAVKPLMSRDLVRLSTEALRASYLLKASEMASWGTALCGKEKKFAYTTVKTVVNPPTGRSSRMPPTGPSREELTWSWAYTTGHPASDQKLEAAAKAAWSYSLLCARTYLNDLDAARELMEHAVHNASRYVARHSDAPLEKLTARIKSVIRRRAKQLSAKRNRELSFGSMLDMESLLAGELETEKGVFANELLSRMSPFARAIVNRRWNGYTWREIAGELEMDHTAVRRAYLRELESVLQGLSRSGDSPKCD